MKYLVLLAALFCGAAVGQTATVTLTEDRGFQPMVGTSNIGAPVSTEAACDAVIAADAVAKGVGGRYKCRNEKIKQAVYNGCPVAPPPATSTIGCTPPSTGQWDQTTTVTIGPAPLCTRTTVLSPLTAPAGACSTSTNDIYFSDCQSGAVQGCQPGNNSNPGTQAAPKQNLAGTNVNTLPAGTRLLFKRGGAWAMQYVTLDNPNATAAAPLVFDAYGNGAAPLIRTGAGANTFNIGGGWNNTSNDGGYVIRNLKLDGQGVAEWGVWFVQNVRDVVLEGNEITGFRIAINSNQGAPHGVRGITLRNNNIHRNRAMGLLGHYNNLLIEGNTIEANNFSGSTFDHGTYIGGGHNITLRNNRFIRNSVVDGVCRGGNMTFHGQIDGLLIEGNTIEQDAAVPGCWLMSITQGYTSAEWFRNTIVRNNKLINGGNSAMVAQSAPGILIEGNVVINRNPTAQTAIWIGSSEYQGGDVPDADATVRNNIVCQGTGASGAAVVLNSPGGSATGNVVRTGVDAATGPCAP